MALSPKAKEALARFGIWTGGTFHEADLKRWHRFVAQAHADGCDVDEADVVAMFRDGVGDAAAVRLGGRYVEERMLLAAYDEERPPTRK